MPLEWTGNQRFPVCVPKSLPATQGQRWKDANSHCSRGYDQTVLSYLICHQPSSGMANLDSSSSSSSSSHVR